MRCRITKLGGTLTARMMSLWSPVGSKNRRTLSDDHSGVVVMSSSTTTNSQKCTKYDSSCSSVNFDGSRRNPLSEIASRNFVMSFSTANVSDMFASSRNSSAVNRFTNPKSRNVTRPPGLNR